MSAIITVDWGTTRFRAARLDASGAVLEAIEDPRGGILQMTGEATGFERYLADKLGPWLGDAPVLMAGMIGSRQGWIETPYVEAPASLSAIAGKLQRVPFAAAPAFVVPGVVCRAASGALDVMRGEETQILGAMALESIEQGLIVLPGTHSKWTRVENGQITGFATSMTGELFDLLGTHGLLARTMTPGAFDGTSFLAGVERARAPGGLSHLLFGVRTEGLLNGLSGEGQHNFLSGLLIGAEIAGMRSLDPDAGAAYVIASSELAKRYGLALTHFDITATILSGETCAHAGLLALAQHAELLS
ncbi:2-dehydro-3-deoxygalactonokinase [Breoghania sp. L-A4]|uniref:2-dehydro-3-deoxygalactonokinase n=1 Tax=Breoghania sp. L-A4 TaxID=2304600 RepID=UPI000E360CC3|nr:2-dehydro-3-deoxygalactonokinase [Breoghania sp. L-A4]AXS39726.1 2-dehydro-3-deoxygalactonokinase [Breoghania sp. L-A4]